MYLLYLQLLNHVYSHGRNTERLNRDMGDVLHRIRRTDSSALFEDILLQFRDDRSETIVLDLPRDGNLQRNFPAHTKT